MATTQKITDAEILNALEDALNIIREIGVADSLNRECKRSYARRERAVEQAKRRLAARIRSERES